MIFHLHTNISNLFRRCLSLRHAPYFLAVAALSVSLTGCVAVPLTEGKSVAAATSEAAVEQSWVDRHRDLFEEEAPFFGKPGQRRAVWSPGELSMDALQRIGLSTEDKIFRNDNRVTSLLGLFDHQGNQESIHGLWDRIGIDFWPKRIAEWGDGEFVEFSSLGGARDIPIWRMMNPDDPEMNCWMLADTRYGALGVLVIRRSFSAITLDEACVLAAGALEKYLEEFALWLDVHPEFDPPLEAYGPRD